MKDAGCSAGGGAGRGSRDDFEFSAPQIRDLTENYCSYCPSYGDCLSERDEEARERVSSLRFCLGALSYLFCSASAREVELEARAAALTAVVGEQTRIVEELTKQLHATLSRIMEAGLKPGTGAGVARNTSGKDNANEE